eukprot:1721585-Heterocapsa_arctica.AAC.1
MLRKRSAAVQEARLVREVQEGAQAHTKALGQKEKERKELEESLEEAKRKSSAEHEANLRAGAPSEAPGGPQGTAGVVPVEVELGDGQEEESWEVWLVQARKRSQDNFQKALDEASKQ